MTTNPDWFIISEDVHAWDVQIALLHYKKTVEQEEELRSEYKGADLAYQNRDGMYGDFGYQIDQNPPTQSQWTEREGECATPAVLFVDGLDEELAMGLNLSQLEDETQRARETVCPWCNLLTLKRYADCQSCDKPLERNVR